VPENTTIRTMGFHRDSVTGVDMVFAGISGTKDSAASLGILTGVYNPADTGRIQWTSTSELAIPQGQRVMGFAEANGVYYCATSNYIYRRTDGALPSWEQIYEEPDETAPVGIRGLTAVPNPSGSGEVLIFVARAEIRRLDPANDHAETVEKDVPNHLSDLWNLDVSWVLAAYNEFFPYTVPNSGEVIWLVGFESIYGRWYSDQRIFVRNDKSPTLYFAAEARYLIRHADGSDVSYEVNQIQDPADPTLVATRTFAVSPFAEDEGMVFYFGGFDCNSEASTNTAWIYRGDLRPQN
jgi:hypothetical protein